MFAFITFPRKLVWALILAGSTLLAQTVSAPGRLPNPSRRASQKRLPPMFAPSAKAGTGAISTVVLDFDELQCDETIGDYYAGGTGNKGSGPGPNYGITFAGGAQTFSATCPDGANTANIPSYPNGLAFLPDTSATVMDVAAGFTGGMSFYYTAAVAPGLVRIWSGPNATGDLLAALQLPQTQACPEKPIYCVWAPASVTFSGVAQSVDFGSSANFVGLDDIALGISFLTSPGKTMGNPSDRPGGCPCGEPISLGTGNLFLQSTDYETSGPNKLAFIRYYNSQATVASYANILGVKWRSNYDRFLRLVSATTVTAERQDGRQINFTLSGGAWTTDSDVDLQLAKVSSTQYTSTWTLTDENDNLETYTTPFSSNEALLTSIQARNGYTQTIRYNSKNQPVSVTDSYGRTLQLAYQNGVLRTLTTPDNQVTYGLDSSGLGLGNADRLKSVTYSTTPPSVLNYVYEDSDFAYAVSGIVDENGNRYATWTYDAFGRANSFQLARGADKLTIVYNDADGSRTVTNALSQVEIYRFANLQNVPKLIEVDRPKTVLTPVIPRKFTYDNNGYLASQTDWNQNLTSFVNDSRGQRLSITEADGSPLARTTTMTYHPAFHLPATIVKPGITTSFSYDSSGNLTSRTETDTTTGTAPYSTSGSTRKWSFTWSNFLPASVQGPRADVTQSTSFTFDSTGGLTQVTNALNQTTKFTNTAGGYPLTVLDPNGVTTQLSYDGRMRLISSSVMTSGGAMTNTWTYDPAGNLTGRALPGDSPTTYSYDAAHRLTAITDPFRNSIVYQLNAFGEHTQENITDAFSATLLQHTDSYDFLGRLVQDMGAAGQTSNYTYDFNYNLLTATDPAGHLTTQNFDALNRAIKVTDANGGITRVTYDASDRVTALADPSGAVTTYTYDGFGDMIQQVNPASGVTVFRYDSAGNLIQKTDPRRVITNFTYDALNRRTGVAFAGSSSEGVTLTYDQSGHGFGIGRLTSAANDAGTLSRNYDEQGNLVRESLVRGGVTLNTSYARDGAGRISSITYPSGLVVRYTRDAMGRVTDITATPAGASSASSVLFGIAYQPFGVVKALGYGNSSAETRSFDTDYQMTNLTDTGIGTLQNLTYAYDVDGNVASIADGVNSANNQAFRYDNFDRLAGASGNYGAYSYAYDANGNRLSDGVNPSSLDGLGSATNYTYNQAGRLASIASAGQQITQYGYDAFGRRIAAQGSTTTLYQYDPAGALLEEADGKGAAIADYIYLDGRPVAEVALAGGLYYLYSDRLGVPQLATNAKQGQVWAGTYQPFGILTPSSQVALLAQDLRLPGQVVDPGTGFYHNGFRDYIPALGRYAQSDPLGLAGGMNLYAYANSNPVSNYDRSGLDPNSSITEISGQITNLALRAAAQAPGVFLKYPEEQITAHEILGGISAPAIPEPGLNWFYPPQSSGAITSIAAKPCF